MATPDRRASAAERRKSVTPFRPITLLRNTKEAENLKELNLVAKNLGTKAGLDGLEAFSSLEVLHLENNVLTEIPAGLRVLGTLRELYLSENELTSLEGSCLPALASLEKLVVSNNKLENLESLLKILTELAPLRELAVAGNPLTETEHYKEKILERFPLLQVLDGEALTAEVRAAAHNILYPPEPPGPPLLNDPTKISPHPHVSPQSVQVDVGMMTRLKAMLVEARRTVKARRILMMPDFMDVDRRKEECVIEPEFIRILDLYGLLPKKTHSKDRVSNELGAVLTSVSDLAILLSFYATEAPQRCRALGRDKRFQEQYFVNYVAFCRDVEPVCGGRDTETSERILEEQWKDKAPAISECLQRLRRDVKAIKSRMAEEKEAAWCSLASSSNQQARPRTEVCVPYKFKATSSTKLGAWEVAELKKLLRARGDANRSGALSREDLVAAVKDMETRGRRLVGHDAWGAKSDTTPPSNNSTNNNRNSQSSGGSQSACPPELEAVLSVLDPKSSGRVSWKDFVAGVEADSGPFARLQWVKLRGPEALSRSKELFKQASLLQNTLSLGAVSGKAAEDMEAQVKTLSQLATRLQRQAGEGGEAESEESGGGEGGRGAPHRRSSTGASSVGRMDFVQTVEYLHNHRRALSTSVHAKQQHQQAGHTHTKRRSSSALRERFGLIEEVRDKFAVKQQLKGSGRGPYATSVQIV